MLAILTYFRHCFKKVVVSDTRDAYFQADPFQFIHNGFYATLEQQHPENNYCLGCNGFAGDINRKWIDAAEPGAAEKVLAKWGREVAISCSGTSLATAPAMMTYMVQTRSVEGTDSMWRFTHVRTSPFPLPTFRALMFF